MRMDRLESMAAFVAVAERGGFTPASRHLGMPVPTLSRKVSELEAHLQVRLLIRSTRLTLPTEAGQRFLIIARRLLEEVAEAERSILADTPPMRGNCWSARRRPWGGSISRRCWRNSCRPIRMSRCGCC